MVKHTAIKFAALVLVVLGAAGIGYYSGVIERVATAASDGGVTVSVLGDGQPKGVDVSAFWRAWNILEENFVETHASSTIPTEKERLYGAIAGLTDSYGDPYTTFFPPVEAQAFQEAIQGEFGGVGMEVGQKDGKLIVVAPLKDSPAEKAGVLSGDFIVSVDGKSTDGWAVDEAVSKIRGPKGTPVKLTIVREGKKEPIEISILRDTIQIPIVKNYLRADGIYVIELYSFSANSSELFRSALREFVLSGSNKLVLDLRGNPGGYLEAAVQMASFFLPVGTTIVTEDSKGKHEPVSHRSLGYNIFSGKNLQMVILIDQGSASASEILAGALQQNGVAKLVGTRSFGKGSVQQLIDLGDGAQIKVTVARWLTPNGSSISDGGLKPDIAAERTVEDYQAKKDPQTDAAVKYLLGK
jgi:carboxyl-terminal processing protease